MNASRAANAFALASLFALTAVGSPARAERDDGAGPGWSWDRPHRYYLDVEVQLPTIMWFVAEFNKQARAVAFRVRAVVDCDPGVPENRRTLEVECDVVDLGLTAGGLKADAGLLQPILEHLDERLTGSTIQMQVREDGRIVNVDLEDLDRRNRRVGQMNENLRLVMSRALAGLDLELPGPDTEGAQWVQHTNLAMMAPSAVGSAGASEVLHQATPLADGTLQIRSSGRGMVVPFEAMTFEVGYEATGVFDPRIGALASREWVAIGRPTSSALTAEGFAGIPYVQRGALHVLGQGEQVDVGETLEVHAPIGSATTLQLWPVFGVDPG